MSKDKKDKNEETETSAAGLQVAALLVALESDKNLRKRVLKALGVDKLTDIANMDSKKGEKAMKAGLSTAIGEAVTRALVEDFNKVLKRASKMSAKRGEFEAGGAYVLTAWDSERLNERDWLNWRMGVALLAGTAIGVGGTLAVQRFVLPMFETEGADQGVELGLAANG